MPTLLLLTLWLFLTPVDPVQPHPPKHREAVMGLSLSPDGKQVASLSRDGLLYLWDVKAQTAVQEIVTPRLAVALRWLQPGKLITVGSMSLANIDPRAGKVLTMKRIDQRSEAGAITPDGRFAAVGNTHFVGRLLNVETGEAIKPYPAPSEWSYAMDITADSSLLAIGGRNPGPDTITLVETKDFTTVRHWPTHLKNAFGLRFAPDGKSLVSVGDDEEVKVWNGADGSLAQSFPLSQPGAFAACFSPDSKYLAVCCGVPVKQLAPSHFELHPNGTTPSDRVKGSFVQVWNLKTKQEVWRSEPLTTWATSILFIANDRIVTGHYDGRVQFWVIPKQ
jgi:WD40 repeat protein